MTENTTAPADNDGKELAKNLNPTARIDDEVLAKLDSTEKLDTLFSDLGAELDSIDDYGSGFDLLDKARGKDSLVGVPFIVVSWRFSDGDNGLFVSMHIVTADNRKLIVNDGSTGIRDQLLKVQRRREREGRTQVQMALKVKNGLKRQTYDYTDPSSGEVKKATTYYLS